MRVPLFHLEILSHSSQTQLLGLETVPTAQPGSSALYLHCFDAKLGCCLEALAAAVEEDGFLRLNVQALQAQLVDTRIWLALAFLMSFDYLWRQAMGCARACCDHNVCGGQEDSYQPHHRKVIDRHHLPKFGSTKYSYIYTKYSYIYRWRFVGVKQ